MDYRYIFGPVPSRRFGLSLGIDLVPQKVCSLNCLYCECGKTTQLTLERKEYIKSDDIIDEIKTYLKTPPKIDVITITGSGEPTLNSKIGEIINYIKKNYNYTTVLLTNGTLLYLRDVRNEITPFDIVKISLDAISQNNFKKINLAEHSLNNEDIINGILEFKKIYKGKIWIEIFIIPGINDTIEEITLFKEKLLMISPDKIQLNTLHRPPAFQNIKKASKIELEYVKNLLDLDNVEIIGKFTEKELKNSLNETILLSLLKRRPLTLNDIEKISDCDKLEIEKLIKSLIEKKYIQEKLLDNDIFYYIT